MSARRVDLLSAVVFVVCWSSGFTGARLGTGAAGAMTVLAWRFTLLAGLLWVVCLALRLRPRAATLRRHLALGTTNQLVYLGLIFTAIGLGVPAGLAALVAALQPLVVSTVAGPVLGERVTTVQRVGLVVGLVGVGLVVGGDVGGGDAPPWAYALPFVAMLSLSSGTVLERRWRTQEPLLQVVAVQSTVAAAGFWVAALVTGTAAPPADPQFWVAVVWLVVLSSIGGYGTFVFVARRQGATRASILLYLTPPTTMVWAYLQFGDALTAVGLAGLVVSAVGVVLALRGRDAGGGGLSEPAAGPAGPVPGGR